jgi:hypothetical protein
MGTGARIGHCLMTQTLVAGVFLLVTAMAAAGAAVAGAELVDAVIVANKSLRPHRAAIRLSTRRHPQPNNTV